MEWISELPIWALAAAIVLFRVIDVSLGTIRVIFVVNGFKWYAAFLGFFEVLIWLAATSQVLLSVRQHPGLMLAYAGGFAGGNVVGVALERKLAMGRVVTVLISIHKGTRIANELRALGYRLTTILGKGRDGPRTIIYVTTRRRRVSHLLRAARKIDPDVFHVVNQCSETSSAGPLRQATGLRSFFKRK